MRGVTVAFVLGLSFFGCNMVRGQQVPLATDDTVEGIRDGCILMYQIVDVIADPETGTPVVKDGEQVKWPKGFTAWRVGTETEVTDGLGMTVLRTGQRYWICPSRYLDGWVVGDLFLCPPGQAVSYFTRQVKCDLGFQLM